MTKKPKNRKTIKTVKEDEVENKSFFQKHAKVIVPVFFLTAMVLLFIEIRVSRHNLEKRLLENPGYSIATVVRYSKGGRTSATAKVSFFGNNKKIEKTVSDGVVRRCEPGSKYIILYNKKDPEEVWLLMDYRINRYSNYLKYMEELKTKPPVLRR